MPVSDDYDCMMSDEKMGNTLLVTLTTFDRTDKRDICGGNTLGQRSVGHAEHRSLDRLDLKIFFLAFSRVFMDRDEVEVVKYAKNEKLTKLILWPRGILRGQDEPNSGSQSEYSILFILPVM